MMTRESVAEGKDTCGNFKVGDFTKQLPASVGDEEEERNRVIDSLREEIDRIDARVIECLKARFALSLAVGQMKGTLNTEVYVPWREEQILSRIATSCEDRATAEALRRVYMGVFEASRNMQSTFLESKKLTK